LTTQGIIIGGDSNIEYLIPIWFDVYKKTNDYPITFFDFGLSLEMKTFCKKHFDVISIDELNPSLDLPIHLEDQIKWELLYSSNFYHFRKSWFKKPQACSLSPYDYSIWIDLDCLVYTSLSAIFEGLNGPILSLREEGADQILLEQELNINLPNEITYNSGVILFSKLHPVIELWAKKSMQEAHRFIGDQHILSRILFENSFEVKVLPKEYNWSYSWGQNNQIKIHHFHGIGKKELIETYHQLI